MLRRCQPARWSAIMVSARWRLVLASPVAGSAVVPPARPAERRFAPGAGQATPLLRGVHRPGSSVSWQGGVPPCRVATWSWLAGASCWTGGDQSPRRYPQPGPHAALLHKAAFCEVAASRSQAPLVSPTAARPGGSTKQALCKVSLAGAGASAASAPPGRCASCAPPPVALVVCWRRGSSQALRAGYLVSGLRPCILCVPRPPPGPRPLRGHWPCAVWPVRPQGAPSRAAGGIGGRTVSSGLLVPLSAHGAVARSRPTKTKARTRSGLCRLTSEQFRLDFHYG